VQLHQYLGLGIVSDGWSGIHAGPVKHAQGIELAFTAQQRCSLNGLSTLMFALRATISGLVCCAPIDSTLAVCTCGPFHLINHVHMMGIVFSYAPLSI